MIKRILSVILMCTVLCIMSGCKQLAQNTEIMKWEMVMAPTTAKKQARIILDCFKTGKTEDLEALFCKTTSSSYDLNKEIAEAIEFIDGNIIDDGNLEDTSYREESISDGKIDKLTIAPSIYHIKTDTGKEYQINFGTCLVNEDKPEKVGMTYIMIEDDESKVTIG